MFVDEQSIPENYQDGKDGDEEIGYIANMKDSATAGFKYLTAKDKVCKN